MLAHLNDEDIPDLLRIPKHEPLDRVDYALQEIAQATQMLFSVASDLSRGAKDGGTRDEARCAILGADEPLHFLIGSIVDKSREAYAGLRDAARELEMLRVAKSSGGDEAA